MTTHTWTSGSATARHQVCARLPSWRFPPTYLGLPLTAKNLKLAHFSPLITKVDKYLLGWSFPPISRWSSHTAQCCTGRLMSHRTRWDTPRGRYDEHISKFSLSMKPRFNRPVDERNHFWRFLLADFDRAPENSWWRVVGASSNVEPAHNTTKLLCPNLKWGCQSH
jgi:hypothetical protein